MAFGEVFVGALFQVLLEMLASGVMTQIIKYVKGKKIDPTTIKKFEDNLRMIAALLQDAEQRRIESAAFKIWVEELQDLAYDLDDVLDELATDAQLQLQQQGDDDDDDEEEYGSMARNITCLHSAKTKVKSIIACGSRVAQRFHYSGGDLPSKIQEINNRLEQLQQQGQNLGLLIIGQGQNSGLMEGTQQMSGREITSLVNEPVLLGRDEKKREVIRELLKKDSTNGNYVVIPIVGKGGIGKTTLAQFVYNDDQQLKDHFNIKAWLSVSDVFDVTRLTTNIINSSSNLSLKFDNLDQAQNKLIEVITDKKFLIVLDDIWNDKYDVWSEFQKPFQYGATGSKVIVTTRNLMIARMVITSQTHRIFDLEGLLDEDCWSLFQHHANEVSNNDLVEMKDVIINKCNGLPLAAKALGGLFRKTTKKSQRWMILNNNVWIEESNVLPVLRLSYYHLPPHLKHTFAFCCTFPKDYEFKEMEVILLWMAQGFLIRGKEERFEDIGHLYLDDLVSRSLFERSPSTKNCYIMHDLVHDLAQWAASDVCCCIMDMKDVQRKLERTRHLYATSSVIDHSWKILEPVVAQLRTFICPDSKHINGLNMEFPELLGRFRCMRTLVLASDTVVVLPECVGDLKHLRFLELRFTKIRVLPDSIKKLCNLQVLFVEKCWNLRNVENVRFLVKLRHLRFDERLWEAMPREIGKLTELQSLGVIYLGVDNENGSIIRELRRLNQLHGELSIIGMENVRKVEDAREAELHEKKGLTKLYLDRDEIDDKNERDILEELRPSTSMEKLKLRGYMGMTLPAWLGDGYLKNMVSLEHVQHVLFGDMTLESEERIELAHLVELDISICNNFRSLPEDLLCPSIESIQFICNDKQEALPEQLHTFTSLEHLEIMDSTNMKRFPKGGLPKTMKSFVVSNASFEEPPIGEWGIHLLPHLHHLHIGNMGRSTDKIECIPGPHLPLPSSLSCLEISDFENLKSINCASFPNLTKLEMFRCPKLENLVDYTRPPNLKLVRIEYCPMIQQQRLPDPNDILHIWQAAIQHI